MYSCDYDKSLYPNKNEFTNRLYLMSVPPVIFNFNFSVASLSTIVLNSRINLKNNGAHNLHTYKTHIKIQITQKLPKMYWYHYNYTIPFRMLNFQCFVRYIILKIFSHISSASLPACHMTQSH